MQAHQYPAYQAQAYAYPYPQAYPQQPAYPQAPAQPPAPAYPQPYAYPQVPGYPQAPAYPHAQTQAQPYPQAPAPAPPGPPAYPQAQTQAQAYPQAPTDAQAYPQAQTQAPAYPQAPTDAQAYPQAQTQAQTQAQAYPPAPADAQVYPQAQTQAQAPAPAPASPPAYPQAQTQAQAYPPAPADAQVYPQAQAYAYPAYPQAPMYPYPYQAPAAPAYPQVYAMPQGSWDTWHTTDTRYKKYGMEYNPYDYSSWAHQEYFQEKKQEAVYNFTPKQFQKLRNHNTKESAIKQLLEIGCDASTTPVKLFTQPITRVCFCCVNTYTTAARQLGVGPLNDAITVGANHRLMGYFVYFLHNPKKKVFMEYLEMFMRMTSENLTVYYTGHGAQIKDTNGDEADGFDEVMVFDDGYMLMTIWRSRFRSTAKGSAKCCS